MTPRRYLPGFVLMAATAGIGSLHPGLLLTRSASAVTSFNYTQPRSGFLMVPAGALAPQSQGLPFLNYGSHITTSATAQVCFNAPVNLPQVAMLASVQAWHVRPDAADTIFVVDRRHSLPNEPASEDIANTALTQARVRTTYGLVSYGIPAALRKIQNQTYAYVLTVCLPTALYFAARAFTTDTRTPATSEVPCLTC